MDGAFDDIGAELDAPVVEEEARWRLHSFQPDHGASQMDEAHERWKRLLAPEGDPSEAFELVEEAFDLMALLVEPQSMGGAPARLGLALI